MKVILLQRSIKTKEVFEMCQDIANKDMSKIVVNKQGDPIGITIHEE